MVLAGGRVGWWGGQGVGMVGGVGGRIVMGHPVHIHSVHVYRYCKILGLNLEA